ncbi:MAG: phospholipid carrier-dependent glycosyltransferase, partial [Planctomycetes bacterium]|nr:phospholipid carrier-dependent glycosyltransferase [Planctomycetota bacterium]
MSEPAHDQPPPSAARPPLIPFLIWSAAILAYPACLLVDLLGSGLRVQGALYALPMLLADGIPRLYMVLLSGGLWAVATGAGMAILRRTGFAGLTLAERAIFGGALGMGILSLGTFLLGTVPLTAQPPWLFAALCWALVLGMAWLGARELWAAVPRAGMHALRTWWQGTNWYGILLAVLGALIVFIALTRANLPVVADYDSLEYHLAAPAAWHREGRITFLRDMVYANFPLNTEMLFLAAMNCFGGPETGAVVGLQALIGFVLLAAAGVAACGRRLGSSEAGKAGAALLLTTPLLAELATLNSYVTELPLAAYGFLALFAFFLWRRAESTGDRWRYAALSGVMCGLAIGTKYPAVVFVLAPVGVFILACGVARLRLLWSAVRSAALVGAVAVTVASPWLIRNTVNTGNPTYPLLYHTFGGRNWSPEQEAKFQKAHTASVFHSFSINPMAALATPARRFWSYAVWRDQPIPASPILLLFALVPIALADRRSAWAVFAGATLFLLAAAVGRFGPGWLDNWPRLQDASNIVLSASLLAIITAPAFLVARRDAVFLGVLGVLCLMAWYVMTHRLDRFLDPVSPAIALLGGLGVAAFAEGRGRRLVRSILAGGLAYTLITTLLIHGLVLWVALGGPRATFLRKITEGTTYSHTAIEAINKLPESATVLFVGESRTFYCRRRCIAVSVFDRGPIERLLDAGPPGDPACRVRDGLRALGVTHLYVNWQELSRLANTYKYHFGDREHEGLP